MSSPQPDSPTLDSAFRSSGDDDDLTENSDSDSDSDSNSNSETPQSPVTEQYPIIPPFPFIPEALVIPQSPVIPSSDPGVDKTSPIVGTREEKAALKKKKTRKSKAAKAQQQKEEAAKQAAQVKLEGFEAVINLMKARRVKFGELMEFVFDPRNGQEFRYNHFFGIPGLSSRVLDLWVKRNSDTAYEQVSDWAVGFVEGLVKKEARQITASKELQTAHRVIDQDLVTSFRFQDLTPRLEEDTAVVSARIIRAIATSPYADQHSPQRKSKTDVVVTTALLSCLGEYSQRNNLVKRIIGLYLYATGTQRQVIGMLSSLGIAESYSNLVSQNIRKSKPSNSSLENLNEGGQACDEPSDNEQKLPPRPDAYQYTGTLRQLSESCRQGAQGLAAKILYGSVYDNINIGFRAPEQTVMNHSSQENGTCATIFPLHNANVNDIRTADFQEAFFKAPQLSIRDILHTKDEANQFKNNITFTILRIIINFGGDGLKAFATELNKRQPMSESKIDVHKTKLYPLPSWNIDESTITGNADVDQAIVNELRLPETGDFWEYVRFQGGDQLSIARLRALEIIRAGHEGGYDGFFWGAWIPGLFHGKMTDIIALLLTHWGNVRNPASLSFHNTRLDRTPIILTSLPNFRTCRDLIFTCLYAHVLHCLLKVSGYTTLDEYVKKVTSWDILEQHARQIYDQFVDVSKVHDLRWKRRTEILKREQEKDQLQAEGKTPPEHPAEDVPLTQGDIVYENVCLFLRDSLTSREFTEAVKSGDSGRILLVIKIWALSFRGSGRTKYAYEMLHLIHNLTHVWPKPIREIVLHNWLLNPTGNPNSFVELDLVQEHLNYWIKVFYKAHGANATWEWLQLVSPCVNALRHLASTLNDGLGSYQGTRHAPPDLSNDISLIMESLTEHKVYEIIPGRMIDKDDVPTKDIVTVGIEALTDNSKNPLKEYNEAFVRLQRRRKITPVGQPAKANPAPQPRPPSSPPPVPPPLPPTAPLDAEEPVEEADEGQESDSSDDDFIHNGIDVEIVLEEETSLRLESAEDVDLDMDLVEVFEGSDDDGMSGTESANEADDAWLSLGDLYDDE
ncbi:hypothetical protein BDN72DRAFT_962706 [Pluteus cervinus]|uniref:Uncharacterized protein n=1 Tax=Pluteus cervinus TaxID=181527 RepID=A0ACD3AI98_9AGAR|nr:hypothetical protein BDN72DRAFT_962706 [Pluteus cervinus]